MKRSNAPAMPWVLGLAGLVPFCGLAAGAWLAPPPYDAVSLSGFYVYAAVILSFLGGTRWGFELAARSEHPSGITLLLSNLPALMGWFGVMLQLVQPVACLVVLTVGLVLVWLWD
nr:DUF3429 domain-containing protein [Hyphomonadaceae bacterium]